MPASPRGAARRILSTAAITGAALTVSAVAALPALGDSPNGQGRSHNSSTSQSSTSQSSTDPAGNNGTVFIHQAADDSHPHNQPHVTCDFFVSFFGFDNTQSLSISFAGQAPTGKDKALTVNDNTPTTLTSTTPAGGAGHDYDGDLGPFGADNLGVATTLGAPAHEGWHIKLTVDTGQGGGHKYKVFWLAPCNGASGANGANGANVAGASTNNSQAPSTVQGNDQSAGSLTGGAQVAGESAVAPQSGSTTGGAQVLGEHFTRKAAPAGAQVLGESASRAGSLPFTGAEIGLMSAAGLALLGSGSAVALSARRRRRAATTH